MIGPEYSSALESSHPRQPARLALSSVRVTANRRKFAFIGKAEEVLVQKPPVLRTDFIVGGFKNADRRRWLASGIG